MRSTWTFYELGKLLDTQWRDSGWKGWLGHFYVIILISIVIVRFIIHFVIVFFFKDLKSYDSFTLLFELYSLDIYFQLIVFLIWTFVYIYDIIVYFSSVKHFHYWEQVENLILRPQKFYLRYYCQFNKENTQNNTKKSLLIKIGEKYIGHFFDYDKMQKASILFKMNVVSEAGSSLTFFILRTINRLELCIFIGISLLGLYSL